MTIGGSGWQLVCAEARHAAAPTTFAIPDLNLRQNLVPGDAAKLLVDIETREAGNVVDRGVDRMWVIGHRVVPDGYIGVLDSDAGMAEGLDLRRGSEVAFSAEHIVEIQRPPREYLLATFGPGFFEQND